MCVTIVCDKVVCERWCVCVCDKVVCEQAVCEIERRQSYFVCVTKLCVSKLCVKERGGGGGGGRGGGGAGYRIENKNPTQRCGEQYCNKPSPKST